MESTALYWRPVWQQLEGQCDLYLAQAQSNRAPRGRKRDFVDAERLLRRHVAGELILSFVPGPEQRMWRTMTRAKHQLTHDRVRIHNQLESLLEAATFPSPEQLSSWVGTCPGREESAEVSKNNRSPKGNRMMRRVLNQVAHAAVKTKGSVFQALYRRFVIRLGHNKAIWAIRCS
jgi:transposase